MSTTGAAAADVTTDGGSIHYNKAALEVQWHARDIYIYIYVPVKMPTHFVASELHKYKLGLRTKYVFFHPTKCVKTVGNGTDTTQIHVCYIDFE
jgi:hypothetical protein